MFSYCALAGNELAVPHNISSRLLDAHLFWLFVRAFYLDLPMHVDVNNAIDFIRKIVSHIFDNLLVLVVKLFELWVFLSFKILNRLKALFVIRLGVELINLFYVF